MIQRNKRLQYFQVDYNRENLNKKVYSQTIKIDARRIGAYRSLIDFSDSQGNTRESAEPLDLNGQEISVASLAIFLRNLRRPDLNLTLHGSYLDAGKKLYSLAPVYVGDELDIFVCLRKVFPKTGRSGFMLFIDWEILFCRGKVEVATILEKYVLRPETSAGKS